MAPACMTETGRGLLNSQLGESTSGMGTVYFNNATFPETHKRWCGSPWPSGYGMPTGVLTSRCTGDFHYIQFKEGWNAFGGGPPDQYPRAGRRRRIFVESVSYLRGKHSLKFGF